MRLVCAIRRSKSAADNPCPRAPNPLSVTYSESSPTPPHVCALSVTWPQAVTPASPIPEGGK